MEQEKLYWLWIFKNWLQGSLLITAFSVTLLFRTLLPTRQWFWESGLAAGIEKAASPIARRFLWPVVKKIGRELIVETALELVEVVKKKKLPNKHWIQLFEKLYKKKLEDRWSKKKTIKKRRKAVQRPFTENNLCREVGLNFYLKFKMFTKLLPAEAAHTTLDLFERQSLLVIFYHAFPQKLGTSYSPDGAMVEFEVMGGGNNFIDLQNLLLEIKRTISKNNDGDLRTGTDTAIADTPYVGNNALHSLF